MVGDLINLYNSDCLTDGKGFSGKLALPQMAINELFL